MFLIVVIDIESVKQDVRLSNRLLFPLWPTISPAWLRVKLKPTFAASADEGVRQAAQSALVVIRGGARRAVAERHRTAPGEVVVGVGGQGGTVLFLQACRPVERVVVGGDVETVRPGQARAVAGGVVLVLTGLTAGDGNVKK